MPHIHTHTKKIKIRKGLGDGSVGKSSSWTNMRTEIQISSAHGSKQEQSCVPATPKLQRSGTRGLLGFSGCQLISSSSEKSCFNGWNREREHPMSSSGLCRRRCAHIHTHVHHKHACTELKHFLCPRVCLSNCRTWI